MNHFLKHKLSLIVFVVCTFFVVFVLPVHATTTFGELYITIGDAIMDSKKDDDANAKEALELFEKQWAEMNVQSSNTVEQINSAFTIAYEAENAEDRLVGLQQLAKGLAALEKELNPVDEKAERTNFGKKIQPAIDNLNEVIITKDRAAILQEYTKFVASWTKNERPVREMDIASYGKIETQVAFMRITLAEDEFDIDQLQGQFNTLTSAIDDFVAGKKVQAATGNYSTATLIGLLKDSKDLINEEEYDAAAQKLVEFIEIWPNVEGDIRTKNASLYTKIESNIPLLVSELSKSKVDNQRISDSISLFIKEIELIQTTSNYTYWDSALILLREGLEALLIIIALVAFLKKANQENQTKWIYIGAFAGLVVSASVAIILSTVLQSISAGTSREMMEGYIGLGAAVLMIGVGVWLHNKSSINAWNKYIQNQMNHAISTSSILSMAFVSFLSVFREGAETIIFYAGIAPKMSTLELSLGILIALVILAVFAVVLIKVSGKIPIHRFFIVATILIYLLAFKIIGVSIHTLQLTSVLPMNIVDGFPVISSIGFYPTWETIIPQVLLIGVVIWNLLRKK
ncbi:FTR1 family iron permease [Psychrobacillus vulpis]|uniref:FTR1 family iron permease n=1 Tax=Psychrobacillus vulpis TaxID=2325572 RepID=A0A544TTJ5_9BACI|nr:FTR1 family protein [Psychrobacillus vulpis]TQR20746.1 FTR1 family iron permease [Psychrobacillus vulpis]